MKHQWIGRNQKGQVAIFIALVFQILFVFFAMVINIGLLVHQKINLQNSVDLAAYYGAMKQAENLNAVAHINYQIRQSWKLLVFRYSQMGIAGDALKHPYDFDNKVFRSEDDATQIPFFAAFCTGFSPYDTFSGQNNCREISRVLERTSMPSIPRSTYIAGSAFFNFDRQIVQTSNTIADAIASGCRQQSGLNWYALARFISAYRQDMITRKQALFLVANGMSKETGDLLDLDGVSTREGAMQTFKKNLTPENRDTFKDTDLVFYNSMGAADCGFVEKDAAPKWLSETNIDPTFWFMDRDCETRTTGTDNIGLNPVPMVSSTGAATEPRYPDVFRSVIPTLSADIIETGGATPGERLVKSSLGFEKNPWCMAYVGVSAKTQPNIPFSPFGSVVMTAKAYAKPFGGKIGPWYRTLWPASSNQSSGGKKVDDLAPDRVAPGEFAPVAGSLKNVNVWPTYSRYPGDPVGLRSNLTTAHLGRAIHTRGAISFTWWNHILDEPILNANTDGDPLAWDKVTQKAPHIRDLEIAAIAPDLFDTTYYSVEPDFYRNYQARIEKRADRGTINVRGDLGSRKQSTEPKIKQFGIKDQIAIVGNPSTAPVDFNGKLKYVLLKFEHLLTSWQGKNQEDYSIDDERFGKCHDSNPDGDFKGSKGVIPDKEPAEKATTGNCRIGGRVGYSVKLVDEEYLRKNDLNLGGDGMTGALKNPPP